MFNNIEFLVPASRTFIPTSQLVPLHRQTKRSEPSQSPSLFSKLFQKKPLSPEPKSLTESYGTYSKLLGTGSTSNVLLLLSHDNIYYAVKEFISPTNPRTQNSVPSRPSRSYLKKLTAEYCIGSSLSHPNILKTFDITQTPSKNYALILEYCSGGSLFDLISLHSPSLSSLNCTFLQLLHGVRYLHKTGVVHRDLKPENILFTTSGLLKIADFGVADVYRPLTQSSPRASSGLCGSEPYIAPEQFTNTSYDGTSSDLWSLGIIYFTMRHRSLPWKKPIPSDPHFSAYLKYMTTSTPWPLFTKLGASSNILAHILQPDPNHRANMRDIFEDEWVGDIECCVVDGVVDERFGHEHVCGSED